MTSKEKIKKEISDCINKAALIFLWLQDKLDEFLPKEIEKVKIKEFSFHHEYQKWYSKALKIVEHLAPDRYNEFKSYYEVDPKRKSLGYGTYVIQDYLKGVVPNRYNYPDFNTKGEVTKCFYNQYTILISIQNRIDSLINDIQISLYVELQDTEIETARNLLKINLRAAGVIAGVVLENYLQRVVDNHKISITKKNPTISDFNEQLKSTKVYDTTVWRKVSYLADIRNICAHNKDTEPKKDQVEELIDGVKWVSKNIF